MATISNVQSRVIEPGEAAPQVQVQPPQQMSVAARLTADANRIEYEVDEAGRRIGVKKLTFLDMFQLAKILGQDSTNTAMMNMAMAAASVCAIGEDDRIMFSNIVGLQALMQRLDFHGIAAAQKALERFAGNGEQSDEGKESVKN